MRISKLILPRVSVHMLITECLLVLGIIVKAQRRYVTTAILHRPRSRTLFMSFLFLIITFASHPTAT